MTPAGAPFPYGKDPKDSVIRIAPSYPSLEDLTTAAEIFVVCVKLASIEKILEENNRLDYTRCGNIIIWNTGITAAKKFVSKNAGTIKYDSCIFSCNRIYILIFCFSSGSFCGRTVFPFVKFLQNSIIGTLGNIR